MNISSITSSSITATSSTAIGNTPTTQAAGGSPESDGAQLSKMGELMSKLQDLEASDPDKAKQVLAKIASDLRSQAEQSGDDRMKALAGKFDQASQTGDLSVLKPQHHGGGHHHRPPQGADAAGANPATDSGKLASYISAQHDRMADIESIISNALDA